MAGLPRSVRYEPSFEQSRLVIEPDAKRFDELLAGIEWRMAVDADGCPEMPGTPFRMARATEVPDEGLLRVLFTIDSDDLVSAWWVERVALAEGEEDGS